MPTLTFIDSQDVTHGGVLNSRVLIGRRLSHGIVFDDPSVSRLHAWIDPIADENASWVVTDAGSRTGTFVNDEQITRHPLRDGDNIRVGNVTLVYQDQEVLPEHVTPLELSAPDGVVRTAGILFECSCGAPLWVGNDLAGKRGMCRHCRQPITVPALVAEERLHAEPVMEPAPPPPELPPSLAANTASAKKAGNCAICHSPITEYEETHQCTDCAMTFHSQCWKENFGCSTYGCPQVGILQPTNGEQQPVEQITEPDPVEAPKSSSRDFILLICSVIGSFFGAVLFGSLPAIVALICLIILVSGKARRPGLLVFALLISLVGVAAGLAFSDFWWLDARHLPPAVIAVINKIAL